MVEYWVTAVLLLSIILVPVFIILTFWYTSFNRPVWIAKQTGKDPNDVIWVKDRFKVRMDKGIYVLKFFGQRENAPSFPGSSWSKMVKKQIKYTPERWATLDMSKKIQRGLFLYQDQEGNYTPLTINVQGGTKEMHGLSQNTRMFIAHGIADSQRLSLNARQLFKLNLAAIAGVVILGLAFLFFIIYTTKTQADTAITCAQIFQNISTGQGQPGFIENFAQGVVGG